MGTVSKRAKFSSICVTCKQRIEAGVDIVGKNAAGIWTHDKCADLPVLEHMPVTNPYPSQGKELGRQAGLTNQSRRAALAKMSWYNG